VRNFIAGTRALVTGFGLIVRTPKLLLLGALPALISTVLQLAALGALLYFSGDLVSWMTPFAHSWPHFWRGALRVVLGIALVGGAALLCAVSFIALTLLIGGPFYERIAEEAEQRLGLDTRDDGAPWWRSLGRGLRDLLALTVMALVGTLVLFVLGFVPLVGPIVAPIGTALLGAWLLSLEMIGLVFQRRGLRFGDRRRTLRRHRATALGFGLPTYLLCLVPVAPLIVIPSAVVGGTLMAHQMLAARPTSGGVARAMVGRE
jgi:CysZ protein